MVGVGVPDAGGRGEVEAPVGRDLVVVVDAGPGFTEAAGGAVGFVDDNKVPGGQVVVAVGGDDGGQGGVGGTALLPPSLRPARTVGRLTGMPVTWVRERKPPAE